ncbi:hypothetical protein GCM10027046_14870 [Uliginosibacterium flavum]|uniref:DUF4124 domain-containing protein n=1 Tax=Uliginosibacterium flavum TaxID=1396831 RepID=A0ABV2TPF0_9RHOO
MKRIVLLLALSGLALGAQAEIYKWVDADGKIQYGDAPPKEAKTKKVSGGVMVVPAMVVPPPAASAPAAAPAPVKAKPEPEAREEGVRSGGISIKPEAPAAPADPDAVARAEARQRAIDLCRQNRGSNCENEVDAQLYGQAGRTYAPAPVVIPGWSQPPIRPSNRPGAKAPDSRQSAPVRERESTLKRVVPEKK